MEIKERRSSRKESSSKCEENESPTTYFGTVLFYGQITTAHCLGRIAATDTRVFTKLFWTFIFLGATSALGWQLSKNISTYIERAVDVKISVQTARKLTFPSVTICSMNPFKKSSLRGANSQYDFLVTLDDIFSTPDNSSNSNNAGSGTNDNTNDGTNDGTDGTSPDSQANDNQGDYSDYSDPISTDNTTNSADFFKESKSGDLSDIMDSYRPSLDDIAKFGYKFDDLFLTCSYNQQRCTIDDFTVIPNRQYGNCYTFNHNVNRTLKRTSKVGGQYGLRVVLHADQAEYVGLLGHDSGVRVTVHPSNIQPYPEQLGLNAPAGMATSIGVKLRQIQRHELSGCYDELEDTSRNSSSRFKYSVLSCERECLQKIIYSKCGCYDQLQLDPAMQNSYCSSSNKTQWACKQAVQVKYGADDSTLDCNCDNPCLESVYETKASISRWPSEPFGKIYDAYLEVVMNKTVNASDFGTEILMVHVFFEELNYEQINESESYPADKLMSDIGGTMGLWIGCSICSLFELVEMCGTMIRMSFLKNRTAMKRPSRPPSRPPSETSKARLQREMNNYTQYPPPGWKFHHYMNDYQLQQELQQRNYYYGNESG